MSNADVVGTTHTNRWAVLVGSVFVLLCTGSIYAFSVFAGPLASTNHWSVSAVMIAFTINAAIGPIPTIVGGIMTDHGHAKLSIVLGGVLFALGFLLTGTATTLWQLYLYYGIIGGFGQGFAYSGCLSNTMRFFQDKKGLASGLITGGMGAATVIAAPIANYLIAAHSVKFAFIAMGIVYLIVVCVASLFIKVAPKPEVTESAPATKEVNWLGMLKTRNFYLILLLFGIGAFSGLMIASNASLIGQNMFKLTATVAATYVSIYSLCNFLGRIIWGTVSDKLGRVNTLMIVYVVIALSLFVLATVHSVIGFVVGIVGLGICFGGTMGVFPSLVMENYGAKNQGVNYGIIFLGYSTAAYFAPSIASNIAASHNGNFAIAFYIAIVLAVIGLAINIFYKIVNHAK